MPNHGVYIGRCLLLDSGEQVIGTAGVRGLRMSEGFSSVNDTSQEQHVLAVLRQGKMANGLDPTAAGG
jgi:hypothetical protein